MVTKHIETFPPIYIHLWGGGGNIHLRMEIKSCSVGKRNEKECLCRGFNQYKKLDFHIALCYLRSTF